MVKTKKPMGSGKQPEAITRAKAIDKLINEKVGTRNLDDLELDNNEDEDGYISDLDRDSKVHTMIARSDKNEPVSTTRCTRGNQTSELAQRIASSLDPKAQRVRDEERTNCSLQNTHVFTLSQQLHNANTTNESLRSELAAVRERLNKIEHLRDRLDMELNFERRMSGLVAHKHGVSPTSHKYNPELQRVKGKIRHNQFFPDGGQMSTWITDGESASDWDDHKENFPRFPFPILQSPEIAYKPQHMKYKFICHSPTPLPTPPTSSPPKVILSDSPFKASAPIAGPSNPFRISASPKKLSSS